MDCTKPCLLTTSPSRLQATRTPKFVRGFVTFLAYFMVKHGPATVAATMDRVQPGIFVMLVQQVDGAGGSVCVGGGARGPVCVLGEIGRAHV